MRTHDMEWLLDVYFGGIDPHLDEWASARKGLTAVMKALVCYLEDKETETDGIVYGSGVLEQIVGGQKDW